MNVESPVVVAEPKRPRNAKKKSVKKGDDEKSKSTADQLVELALERYRIGRTEDDHAFAVEREGPNVALMFRGSREALKANLAREFYQRNRHTPNAAALTDAMVTLLGKAYAAAPEPVYLRVAEHADSIVIDVGDMTGQAVIVKPDGWRLVKRSPVLFRRTAATGELPVPEPGGDLSELRAMLNVSNETWQLVCGWLISALVPNIPHPILLLGGQQGAGKTTAAKKLVGLIDPSPVALRSSPRDVESWAISASCSWLVGIDNVSTVPDWLSDSLCKAVTGDGWLRRKLYTDGELAVFSFRRVILLTSIDPGALRGDLGDRILLVDLESIDDTKRRAERDIDRDYDAARPRLFGAVLDLLAKVHAELPNIRLDRMPRMADFARLLAAMDRVTEGDRDDNSDERSLNIYLGQRERIADTVIESDVVAMAILSLVDRVGEWEGTAAELLGEISQDRAAKGWPNTPRALGGRLKRLTPALEQAGILVCHLPRTGRRRVIKLTRRIAQPAVTNVILSQKEEISVAPSGGFVTTGDSCDDPFDPLVMDDVDANFANEGSYDRSDECDEQSQPLSSGPEWYEV